MGGRYRGEEEVRPNGQHLGGAWGTGSRSRGKGCQHGGQQSSRESMGDQRIEASTILRTLKREEEVGIKTRRKDGVVGRLRMLPLWLLFP